MSEQIQWPARPACHDNQWSAQQFGPSEWRNAGPGRAYRSCSYCGSIHPEDLLHAMRNGSTAERSDFKYGWPHKFYITGGPVGHAKWYNEHFTDMDADAVRALSEELEKHVGIRFERDEHGVKYMSVG